MAGSTRARGARALLNRMLLRNRVRGEQGFPRFLYIHSRVSPERTLFNRLALVFALVGLVIVVFWLDRGSLRDAADGEVSFADVVYFTFVTITTVGYGDIVPVGDRARLLDALLVTPIRIFVWLIFLGTAYEFVWRRIVEDLRMKALQNSLEDHIIICGYGYSGRTAARELVAKGQARERIVVIDPDPGKLDEAAQQGHVGLRGDATRDFVMREARISAARAVLVCVTRDDTAVLAVLTARSLNEKARIIAVVRDEENLGLVRKAGADEVVAPARMGGFLAADAVASRYTTRFITDILTSRGGKLQIAERAARPDEIGKTITGVRGRLIVALERDGKIHGFWDHPDTEIRARDLVFAIEEWKEKPEAA